MAVAVVGKTAYKGSSSTAELSLVVCLSSHVSAAFSEEGQRHCTSRPYRPCYLPSYRFVFVFPTPRRIGSIANIPSPARSFALQSDPHNRSFGWTR